MKTTLAVIGIGLTTAMSSLAGPSWGFSLGNGAGFYWGGGGTSRITNNNFYGGGNYYVPTPRVYYPPVYYTPQPTYYIQPRPYYTQPYQNNFNFRFNNCR